MRTKSAADAIGCGSIEAAENTNPLPSGAWNTAPEALARVLFSRITAKRSSRVLARSAGEMAAADQKWTS